MSRAALWEQRIGLSNGQTSGQQTKDQEWLCSRLVLHIILDGIWNEVFVLEEDLQHKDGAGEDWRLADCDFTQENGYTGRCRAKSDSNSFSWHSRVLTCGNMSPVKTAAYTFSCRPKAKYAATAIWVTSIVPTVIHLATSGPKATGKLFKPIFLHGR